MSNMVVVGDAGQVSGDDILEIANQCWNKNKGEYRGWQYLVAVNQAKQQIEKVKGGRKDRKAEAQHTVTVTFMHAQKQSAARLTAIAVQAQQTLANLGKMAADPSSELYKFAEEVNGLLHGPLSAGMSEVVGIFDPSMIITLIMGIVNAIRACKGLTPVTPPAPATV